MCDGYLPIYASGSANVMLTEPRFRAYVKAGIHLKAVFTPSKIGLTEISRSRFK